MYGHQTKCQYSLLAERRRSTPAPKEEEKVNEEQWPLREVVFVEDVKNVPVGKVRQYNSRWLCRTADNDVAVITPGPYILSQVLKVDGAYVAVKFPGTSSSMSNQSSAAPADSDPSSLLQDCRLLRIDELQVKHFRRFDMSLGVGESLLTVPLSFNVFS